MNKRTLGFGILWGLLALLTVAPLFVDLPLPNDALAIHHATLVDDNGEQTVALPRARQAPDSWAHYRLTFQPEQLSGQHLFIPLLSQRAVIHLNGTLLDDTENRTTMVGLSSGISSMTALPQTLLRPDDSNVIDLQLQALGIIPGYLSAVYIGDASALAPYYRLRVFVLEYLKLMVAAGQLLMALVLLVVWMYRPRDELFGWLALLMPISMLTYMGMMRDLIPQLVSLMPSITILTSAAVMVMIIVVLLLAGLRPPRWLKWMPLLFPACCLLLAASGLMSDRTLALLITVPLNILGLLLCLSLLLWAAWRRREEAWLLLLPMLMAVLSSIHDFAVAMALLDGPIFLSVYYRPLVLIGFAMILMRRLGISLGTLDGVNDYLTRRLAEREQQLAQLHAEERLQAAQQVRSEERQRLTNDLHDGLSGHLVSIIALSEREHAAAIEHSAREALDDLRLVIHSLDISDNELPLALSGLRERLERQLKRLQIELDWSTARLPEISGVTPTHALSVLRILQEAITNAIRHGQSTVILVRGSAHPDGRACIAVENNGLPFPDQPHRGGKGLNNMRRRIRQLGGEILIEPLPQGTRLLLLLPLELPPVA